jgi:hypothetical protein
VVMPHPMSRPAVMTRPAIIFKFIKTSKVFRKVFRKVFQIKAENLE